MGGCVEGERRKGVWRKRKGCVEREGRMEHVEKEGGREEGWHVWIKWERGGVCRRRGGWCVEREGGWCIRRERGREILPYMLHM